METMEVDGEPAIQIELDVPDPVQTIAIRTTVMTTEPMEESSATTNNHEKILPHTSSKPQPMVGPVNVMADPSTVPSVTISLHPLVIMNISEHWTRLRAQAGEFLQVYGALIGKQKGRNIEIMNSFELKIDYIGSDLIVNRDYYNTKENQYKQVDQIFEICSHKLISSGNIKMGRPITHIGEDC